MSELPETSLHTDLRELIQHYSLEHGIQIEEVSVNWRRIEGTTKHTHQLDTIELRTMIGRKYGS